MPVFTMVSQVVVLFLLMGLGYCLGHLRIFDQKTCQKLTWLLCYIVMPCLIVDAFQVPFSAAMFDNFLMMFAITAGIHVVYMVLGQLLFTKKLVGNLPERPDLKFTSIYSNCAFMGIPLINALLGRDGVFYASVYITVYGLFVWTHGLLIHTGKFDRHSLVKSLLNPNIIAAVVGFLLYILSLHLPALLHTVVRQIAGLNTALSMMVIGASMTQIPLRTLYRGFFPWLAVAMRNLVFPLVTLVGLWFCGIRGVLLMCSMILSACPVAGLSVLFAQLTGRDPGFACKTLTLSTLLSLLTLPVILTLAGSLQ